MAQIGDQCYAGKSCNKMEEKIDGVTIHYTAKFDKAGKMTHVTDFRFKKEGFMNKFIYKNASCNKIFPVPIYKRETSVQL